MLKMTFLLHIMLAKSSLIRKNVHKILIIFEFFFKNFIVYEILLKN